MRLPNLDFLDQPGTCGSGIYPAGAQYTFERCISSKDPIHWPRCSKVTYSLDTANAPAGYASDVRQAVAQLEAATRLHLLQMPSKADINVSWSPSLYDPRPGTSGEAGVTEYEVANSFFGARAQSANIQLSSHLTAGSQPSIGEESVLLHELGHAVGLGHYGGPVVMSPLDHGFASYQPGDLAGLFYLYQPSSCG